MFSFKKAVPLLMIMVVLLSACSQNIEALQQLGQNKEESRVEKDTPITSNEPSIKLDKELEEADTFDPIVLFELTEDDFKKPATEIPYYSFGRIEFITQEIIQGFAEGHFPWRGSPDHAAELLTQNLIPAGVSPDQVSHNRIRVENENQADELTIVEKIVPDLGIFTISLQFHPESGGICFISKIVWQPAKQ